MNELDIEMPAHGLLLDNSEIDVSAIANLIIHVQYKVVVICDCDLNWTEGTSEIFYPAWEKPSPHTHLIIENCHSVSNLLEWSQLPTKVAKLTFVDEYNHFSLKTAKSLRQLMTAPASDTNVRDTIVIILYAAYQTNFTPFFNGHQDHTMEKIWSDISTHWVMIKRLHQWHKIYIGFLLVKSNNVVPYVNAEYLIDLLKCDTKQGLKSKAAGFEKIFNYGEGDPDKPVSKLWDDIKHDWSYEPGTL